MAIRKVKLPDNSVHEIHDFRIPGVDATPTSGSANVVTSDGIFNSLRVDKIAPIKTKTYPDVLATTSNYNTLFPLFRVVPTEWDEPVIVAYRLRVFVNGHEDLYYSKHECAFSFYHEALLAYTCTNLIGNTSYRTIYYNSLMRCLTAYKSIGHLVGFNYYNNGTSYSRSCTTSGYGRTFVVEILKEDNCTVEWLDSCNTVSNSVVPGYVAGTTHAGIANYNGTTQGETHSGDANTNTVAYYVRTPSATKAMERALYRYRIAFSSMDGLKWIPADTSTSTNATAARDVNQTPINPFGEIAYYYTTTVIAAGAAPAAGNMWRQYEVTLGYSFNRTGAALVLTYPAPVYVKCAPQADGSAIIDATTPYVQSLPEDRDGKIYIFLGVAYSAVAIAMTFDHPVYYHDGTGIRLWNGTNGPGILNTNNTESQIPSSSEPLSTTINLHKVAKTGAFEDLVGKPTIPAAPGTLNTNNGESLPTSSNEALSGNIQLHKVAKTGNYADIIGTPEVDTTPTQESANLVTSGGVAAVLQALSSALQGTNGTVNNLSSIVSALNDAVAALETSRAIIGWNGESTPIVSTIPAGVTVTYNGQTYTGTLQASEQTANTVVLVSDGNGNFDRYITSQRGNTYAWINVGTTAIDMSEYVRKDSEVWLTEEEFANLPVKDHNITYNVYEEASII